MTHPAIAFTHADVLPMDSDRLLQNHMVIVRDGRIAALGPSDQLPIPEVAITIDARGSCLLPGLADMHAHIVPMHPDAGETVEQALVRGRQFLVTFLAAGVTTIRNMAGTELHLQIRDAVAEGRILGPRIYSCGPILETRFTFAGLEAFGELVTTAEAGRAAVRRHVLAGFDFIKVYNDIDADIYDAILDEAKRLGIPVAGHVAFSKGLAGALAAGQDSIEHLRSYDFAVDTRAPGAKPERFEGWLHATPKRIEEVAEKTAEAGSWNVPTLVIERSLRTDAEIAAGVVALVDAPPLPDWLDREIEASDMEGVFPNAAREVLAATRDTRGAMVKALDDVGAGILAGSDCPGCRLAPGRSLLREIELFVEAGLTPYRALLAATRSVAEFLGDEEAGTIAVGKRADLLLVEGDPRSDIRNLRRQRGVAIAGRWLTTADLERMILEA